MSQDKAIAAAPEFVHTLGQWGKMLITFLTMGFVYPNSFTEGMDLSKIQSKTSDEFFKK